MTTLLRTSLLTKHNQFGRTDLNISQTLMTTKNLATCPHKNNRSSVLFSQQELLPDPLSEQSWLVDVSAESSA